MPLLQPLIASFALLTMPGVQAACFTVFDPSDRVVYQATEPPIDISKPFSEGLAAAYGRGHHILMSDNAYCPGFDEPPNTYDAPLPGSRLPGSGAPALQLADAGMSRYRGLDGPTDGADWAPEAVGRAAQTELVRAKAMQQDDTATPGGTRGAPRRGR